MPRKPDGPESELARYAYGWSDKKPGRTYWIVQAVIALLALASCTGVIR